MSRQALHACLSFEHQAEEAARFYVSVFPNSRILGIARAPEGTPYEPGAVMTVSFELNGVLFSALNLGPSGFNQAVSLCVDCSTQEELDRLWAALSSEGGEGIACGWLRDRYGLSWQLVPKVMWDILEGEDQERKGRAMAKMMEMVKLEVAALAQA